MGRDGMREPHGKKACTRKNRKGFEGYEKHDDGYSRRGRARVDGFGRRPPPRLTTSRRRASSNAASSTGLAGFSAPNDKGEWIGLDVDYCRAVAAAIFGDGTKVKFTPLSAKDRFTALQSGEIDILSRNTTWTINRDTALGLNFAGVTYYDGQGFMINAKKLPGVNSALQLSGASVCVQSGTTTELNLADYFKANNLEYSPVVFEKLEEVERCLRRRSLRRLHDRPVGPLRHPPDAGGAGRSCRSARNHLQGAARTCRPPGRRPVVRHRQMDLLRAAERRRARHHQGQCRGDEDFAPIRRSSACSASRPTPRSAPTSA